MITITIDLDNLKPEAAKLIAGFLMAASGATFDEDQLTVAEVKAAEPSPAEVFGNNVSSNQDGTMNLPSVSTAGPTLVIPNPPSALAPTVSTPIQPAVSSGAAVSGTVVDMSNLPWDSRIHSSAKTFNADGTWRARRGLPEGYVPRIEAELRQLMAIPSPTQAASGVPASIPPVAPVPVAVAQSSVANIPLPPATASPSIRPYLDLMNKVSSALAGGRITSPQLQKVCDAVGLPTFVSLGTRLDLVPTVAPMIEGILAGSNV